MNSTYGFSFTAASLRLMESVFVATHMVNGTDIDYVNDLGRGKSTTGKRILTELKKRILNLNDQQQDILVNGDLISQRHIAFLSVCKTHAFIRDFVVEELREKVLVYDYEISDTDYISFYRRKEELYPQLENLTDSTKNKIRQVTFKILEQAKLIDNIRTKVIQPQYLDKQLIDSIAADHPDWLKVFFISDLDIDRFRF